MTKWFHLKFAGFVLYGEDLRDRVRSLEGERGQAFVEYVLLLTLVAIAVALITEWGKFTGAVGGALGDITNVISGTASNNAP